MDAPDRPLWLRKLPVTAPSPPRPPRSHRHFTRPPCAYFRCRSTFATRNEKKDHPVVAYGRDRVGVPRDFSAPKFIDLVFCNNCAALHAPPSGLHISPPFRDGSDR